MWLSQGSGAGPSQFLVRGEVITPGNTLDTGLGRDPLNTEWRGTVDTNTRDHLLGSYSGSCQILCDREENQDIEKEEKFLEEEMKTECDYVNQPPRSLSLVYLQRGQKVCVILSSV